jgi:hypothetical protein
VADTTYLLGLGELGDDPGSLAWLRIGARLVLRRRPHGAPGAGGRGRLVEVRAPDGRPLGHLPPDAAQSVAELLDAGVPAMARVSALVPAFRRQRVQLAIETGQAAGDPRRPAVGARPVVAPGRTRRSRPAMRARNALADL